MKTFKIAAFAVVALSAAAGSAGGTGWFEAGVAGYEKWPTDGDEMHVPAAGVWRGTGDTVLSGDTGARRLVLDTSLVNALCFDLDDQRSIVADAPPSRLYAAVQPRSSKSFESCSSVSPRDQVFCCRPSTITKQ